MDEEGCRSSTNCKCKSAVALINQDALFLNGRSEVRKMLHYKAVDPVILRGVSLARDVVSHLLGEEMRLLHEDRVSLCLKNSVVKMLDKHAILFTSFAKRLACTPENTSEALVGVSNELFLNDCVTWDRIIALYTLAGRLALYYQQNNMHKLAQSIPQHMTYCIAEKIASFVKKNGGWEQLCVEFPPKEDLSGKVWKSLLVTGAGLGIMAALLVTRS